MEKKKGTVFVGMSGGVDSAVSAAILQKQGYDVVGVFIRTWHPEFLVCNEEEERRDAIRVAAHLDIPFLTFDLEDVYKKEVADYMIREYKAGRTPNPDVMCNKEVKFGAFLKKALAMGADFVATGHYAQNSKQVLSRSSHSNLGAVNERNLAYVAESTALHFCLYKGVDPTKDQSYFLWTLNQRQLSKILFPVGHLKKTEVRKLAKKFNLPVAEKKDSQGICFLGAVDLKEFLKHYIKEKRGEVILVSGGKRSDIKNSKRSDLEEPEVIGYHNGVVFYTLGERHGFTITKKNPNDGAYYVVGKDVEKNILYVSTNPEKLLSCSSHSNLGAVNERNRAYVAESTSLYLCEVNWISKTPEINKNYTCQIRYHGELLSCMVKIINKTKAEIMFQKPTLVASGQSVVVYDKNVCFGGGVVVDGVPYINGTRASSK